MGRSLEIKKRGWTREREDGGQGLVEDTTS